MEFPASTFVTLGLSAKRPGSGYELAALAKRSLAYFWPLSRSQLYSELTRLEELGWVEGVAVAQQRYPDKRVFRPTPAGHEALRAWLDADRDETERFKNGVLLKLFLGASMSPPRLERLLGEYRRAAERRREELGALAEDLRAQAATDSRRFGLATIRHGILQAEARIAWVDETHALLDRDEQTTG